MAHFKQEVDKTALLQIMFGEPVECLKQLKETLPSWDKVYFNRDETGYGAERDEAAKTFFDEQEIEVQAFHDSYLHSAEEVKKSPQNTTKSLPLTIKNGVKK